MSHVKVAVGTGRHEVEEHTVERYTGRATASIPILVNLANKRKQTYTVECENAF